ncbi:MAG TPA: undecaprenyl diphosphate synthase family protein, partial [Candidatus Aphodousia gallistercoris]|nr:undecaprenyl diphosphate synthase family protein [Candidatus Aphodousia gallistercoris]
ILWQSAYAELYASPVLWPDFGAEDLKKALAWYAGRQRRFGMTGEQIQAKLQGGSEC